MSPAPDDCACDLLGAIKREMFRAILSRGVGREIATAATIDACERILAQFGGDRLWLPRVDRAVRNARIIAHHQNGEAPKQIARALTVSRRTVERIVRSHDAGLGRPDWML